jgi:hypothetical protein
MFELRKVRPRVLDMVRIPNAIPEGFIFSAAPGLPYRSSPADGMNRICSHEGSGVADSVATIELIRPYVLSHESSLIIGRFTHH